MERSGESFLDDPDLPLRAVSGGISFSDAFAALRRNSHAPHRNWVSTSWAEQLRGLVSDPLTEEQAEALRRFGFRELTTDQLLSWLRRQSISIDHFIRRTRQLEQMERNATRVDGRHVTQQMNRIGLYYPFIEFPNIEWLKVAALFWDKMGRIVPHNVPTTDRDEVRTLRE